MEVQWYPGHMARTRRKIQEQLRNVDAVCEILDARIPLSSRNPDVAQLTAGKPRLVVLNRADLADGAATERWADWWRARGCAVLETDAKSGRGTERFAGAVRALLRDRLAAYAAKGQAGRVIRVMILGIPNVGKSTFINRVARRKVAKAEDRPGVTRSAQWVPVDARLELLDTPGMLWPRFEDPEAGRRLAATGAVRDEILDAEELACWLLEYLAGACPQAVAERYGAAPEAGLAALARARGFLLRGGETDTERMAKILLDEFRGGKLGRITLEMPEEEPPCRI